MDDWPLREISSSVVGERTATIAGRQIPYLVYRWSDPSPDPIGANDGEATIYVSEHVVQFEAQYADLIALHEQIEIAHKARGRSHACAHRRAFVEEILTAKQLFGQAAAIQRYVQWKVERYPPWKVFDRPEAVARLARILPTTAPAKGDLLRVIAAYPL